MKRWWEPREVGFLEGLAVASRAFFFPGYGSHYVGMGKDFYDRYRVVQERFEEASNCVGLNFVKLCFASSEKELSKTENAYLALFVVHAALVDVLHEHGIIPDVVSGWGVGYASAMHAARTLNFPDGLYILRKYVMFFEESRMGCAVECVRVSGVDIDVLCTVLERQEIDGQAVIAHIPREGEYIILGHAGTIVEFKQLVAQLSGSQVHIVHEPVSYGLHAFLKRDILRQLSAYLGKIDCKSPKFALMTQEGALVGAGQTFDKNSMIRFVNAPIDVPRVARSLGAHDTLIEVGSGRQGYVNLRSLLPERTIVSFAQKADLKEI